MSTSSPPRRSRSKDLFENSTMTFGQHLEELRTCLFKAITGLFVGVLLGFAVGGPIVAFVASPLEAALTDYYEQRAIKRANVIVDKLQREGKALPQAPEQIQQLVLKQRLLPEQYFIDPLAVLGQIRKAHPELLKGVELPAATPEAATPETTPLLKREDLLSIFLWRPAEEDDRLRVKSLAAPEAFSIYMKASHVGGRGAGQPLDLLPVVALRGGRAVPARKALRVHLLPLQRGLVPGGGGPGVLPGLQARAVFLLLLQQRDGHRARSADRRVDRLRADAAARFRPGVSVAAGDALPGADPRVYDPRSTCRSGGWPCW